MRNDKEGIVQGASPSRMSKAARRRQLLDTALQIIRTEGADKLTLGHLAACAGVSKPIAYDHFGTRAGLLIELYKAIDIEQSDALRKALTTGKRSFDDVVNGLASAYIHCGVDTGSEYHAVGAALAGSAEMAAVHQQLLDGYVQLFASVLTPHTKLEAATLHLRCIGLIGAGEGLLAEMLRGNIDEETAAQTFSTLMKGGLRASRTVC